MDPKCSTRIEAQPRPGEGYSILTCLNFSLAAALQAAIAVEGYDDMDKDENEENISVGKKRKREGLESSGDENESGGLKGEDSSDQQLRDAAQATPSSSANPPAPNQSRKQCKKERKCLIRQATQNKGFLQNTDGPRPEALSKHLSTIQKTTATINTKSLPANASGYEATFNEVMGSTVLNYDKLIADGYKLVEWDRTKPLVMAAADTERVFAVGVAKPTGDPTYEVACEAAAALLLECGVTGGFTQEEIDENLRGPGFMALNFGIGAGHGPPAPYNLCSKHPDVVNRLRSSAALERLAQHHSAALKFYFPELYSYYHEHTMPVRDRHKDLIPNWVRSIFCAAAVNLGPEVATYLHCDGRNLAFGAKAHHPVSSKVYYPHPSATITHGNTPIQPGETRVSFTQYTPGALFRYVDAGFSTLKKLKKRSKKRYAELMAKNLTCWEMGMGLWPMLDELSVRASGSTSSKRKQAQDP
ncbi:hypothetical protein FA13DRAFT_1808200 [Coprinellus micaceus]|uniref:Uncharacterized protein n=1 Tax=Coprinellus micaceus TaxID=71717 RepID=A0A4Y7U0B1_COPMI|nr:hypothetical protein FA13DRAFT_1808200 [Coprinellus micaceus]